MPFHKKSIGSIIFDILNIIIMSVVLFICIIPLLHVIFASFSEPQKLLAHEGLILKPLGFTLEGYKLLFNNKEILTGTINSIIYVVSTTALGVILTMMGGYVLSRKRFRLRNSIMLFISFTMLFSGGLIPFYLVVKSLGWVNTRLAVIVPYCLMAFNIIMMRTGFMEIPDELEESAMLDGANDFIILFKIYAPAAKATIAVVTLLYAVSSWNSWFPAMIFLRDRSLYPIQLILREIVESVSVQVSGGYDVIKGQLDLYQVLLQYCTMVIATVPILIVYPFLQKYFSKGVMLGSLKG
ncbi:MAG TPA: carbohydrate ABC transporter permease [Defluviitoga tunisiensis]|nr:carbohydrate ABC transporter permease [Defluviitoga tunisiensis]